MIKRRSIISVIIAVAVTVGTFVSCDIFDTGINFSKADDVKKLNELINPHITEGMLVERITFNYSKSSSEFSFNKDMATVVYVDPENSNKRQGIDIDLKTGETSPNSFYKDYEMSKFSKTKAVALKDFDFSKIAEIVLAAQKMFEEDSLKANGLGSFEIDFTSGDMETYIYKFDIQHRTGSKNVGRRRQISYNEYALKADKDGNWIENN
jgi:hypothetical protein